MQTRVHVRIDARAPISSGQGLPSPFSTRHGIRVYYKWLTPKGRIKAVHMLNQGYVYMGVHVSRFESRYLESHLAYNNGGGYNFSEY